MKAHSEQRRRPGSTYLAATGKCKKCSGSISISGGAVGSGVAVGGGIGVDVGTKGVRVLLMALMQSVVPSGSTQHVGVGSALCAPTSKKLMVAKKAMMRIANAKLT